MDKAISIFNYEEVTPRQLAKKVVAFFERRVGNVGYFLDSRRVGTRFDYKMVLHRYRTRG